MQLFDKAALTAKLDELTAKTNAATGTLNTYCKYVRTFATLEDIAQFGLVLAKKTDFQDGKDAGALVFSRTPKSKGRLTQTVKVYRKRDGSSVLSVMNGLPKLVDDLLDVETGEIIQQKGEEIDPTLFGWSLVS